MREALRQAFSETRDVPRPVIPSPERVTQYKNHGVATLRLALNGVAAVVVVDTTPFKNPKYAWLKKFARESLTLVISSGTQQLPQRHKPDGFVELNEDGKVLEGIAVRLHYNVSPRRQIPYDARLEALYRAV